MTKYVIFYCNYNTTFKGLPIEKMGDIGHRTAQVPHTEPHACVTPKPTSAGHRSPRVPDTEGRECWGGVWAYARGKVGVKLFFRGDLTLTVPA